MNQQFLFGTRRSTLDVISMLTQQEQVDQFEFVLFAKAALKRLRCHQTTTA